MPFSMFSPSRSHRSPTNPRSLPLAAKDFFVQRVKLFKSIESELGGLETDINRWIAENQARIISITGNIAPQASKNTHVGAFSASDVLIIVLYDYGHATG